MSGGVGGEESRDSPLSRFSANLTRVPTVPARAEASQCYQIVSAAPANVGCPAGETPLEHTSDPMLDQGHSQMRKDGSLKHKAESQVQGNH